MTPAILISLTSIIDAAKPPLAAHIITFNIPLSSAVKRGVLPQADAPKKDEHLALYLPFTVRCFICQLGVQST